ncbi:hypothetical protein, partial [Sandarakinorhabdus sp.]|uniref:hypothetical protein n=1 Tax=Sandarakinorhabdus sp. TaxID=1916663 RepID=UPI00286DC891
MMRRLAPLLLLLLVAPLPLASAAAQIAAPAAASPGDPAARGFIETMVGDGFATLRDKTLTK